MSAWHKKGLVDRALNKFGWVALILPLVACAEVQVGVELAKRANRAVDANLAQAEPQAQQTQETAAISPHLQPAPEIFEASGIAQWDGKRTLQGIWVAHPLATTARRVRIFNTENDQAVDGALFKRDSALTGASVLISSEAAERLGIEPGGSAELRIVAVTPAARNDTKQPPAATVVDDQTDKPVSNEAAQATPKPEATEQTVAVVAPKPKPVEPAKQKPEVQVVSPTPQATTPETVKPAEPKKIVVAKPEPEPEPVKAEPEKVAVAKPQATQPAKPAKVDTETKDPSDTEGKFKWDRAAAAAPEPAKKAEPAATKPKPVAAADPKPAKPKPAAASKLRQPFIQAGVFGVADNARRLVNRLKKRGIPAVGKPVRGNKKLTRVLAGPFASTAQRNRAQATIRKMGMSDAVPVRR